MDAGLQFLSQGLVDEPLARDAALSDKGGRGDRHGKMRLASRTRSFVPGMKMGLVLYFEARRGEPIGQLLADRIGNSHGVD